MKIPRRVFFLLPILILASLSCNTVLQVLDPEIQIDSSLSTPSAENTPDAQSPGQTVPGGEGVTYLLSEEEQLAIFEELWQIVNEEYLYEDFNGLDWAGLREDIIVDIQSGLSDQEFYSAMDYSIYMLGDEHSIFLSPWMVAAEEAIYAGEQDYAGVGIWIMAQAEKNRAVILIVFPNSPAHNAGLRPHDSILAVNDQPIVDEEGALVATLLGPPGTSVSVTVQTPGKEIREVVIERARITGSLPVPYDLMHSPQEKRIGYIQIPSFADYTIAEKVENALRSLTDDKYMDGLIIDNRLNSGGFSDVFENTLRCFTGGTVGYFANRQGRTPIKLVRKDINRSTQIPLVVLIGEGTASFGEVFAGVLQSSGRAYLIGVTTDGNVETLWGYDFDDGSRAWIAHDTFIPAKDLFADWEATGIIPDLEIIFDWGEFIHADDPVIQAALEYFDEQQ